MRILLVHPDDSVEIGVWAKTQWDLVVDLGWSGRHAYPQQSERLGARVFSILDLLDHQQHRNRIRELLALGQGQLVDSESVDWWDAFSVYPYSHLEQLLLASALAEQIPEHADVFSTRDNVISQALSFLFSDGTKRRSIKSLSTTGSPSFRNRLQRYRTAAFTLQTSKLVEIAFDKWDPDYRLRRHLAGAFGTSLTSTVLLPSAYGNVSRAQVAYAKMLPHRRFLLVVTRRSGRLQELPRNVELRSLASYTPSPSPSRVAELAGLLTRWRVVRDNLFSTNPILRLANQLHLFDGFTNFLNRGLGVRDSWREVFVNEPIAAVLSADENNPYTRLPVWLAGSRNINTVHCDHGALNMTLGIRPLISDTYLMKCEMARDYCVASCGLPDAKIMVGGPIEAHVPVAEAGQNQRDWIVFYSEQYELSYGRTETLYAELLPAVCLLAKQTNRKVIVKLHPFESFRTRKAVIKSVLSAEQFTFVEIREGPMTPDLFARAWCSLTVESSVAVESTLNGVPCFLCSWFDGSWYDYGSQYAKFSAGYPLQSPRQVSEIPQLLTEFQVTEAIQQGLQTQISPQNLERVFSGK